MEPDSVDSGTDKVAEGFFDCFYKRLDKSTALVHLVGLKLIMVAMI